MPKGPGGCNRNHTPKAPEHPTGLPKPATQPRADKTTNKSTWDGYACTRREYRWPEDGPGTPATKWTPKTPEKTLNATNIRHNAKQHATDKALLLVVNYVKLHLTVKLLSFISWWLNFLLIFFLFLSLLSLPQNSEKIALIGSRHGAVLGAGMVQCWEHSTPHQSSAGVWIPGSVASMCGLSLLLILVPAPGSPVFLHLHKPTFPHSNFTWKQWMKGSLCGSHQNSHLFILFISFSHNVVVVVICCQNGLALVRPPGHHAEAHQAM